MQVVGHLIYYFCDLLRDGFYFVFKDKRIIAFSGVLFIQAFFPKGTRTISRRLFLENLPYLGSASLWAFGLGIDPRYFREYRCPTCHKLLAKGKLTTKDDVLEVKCRGCSTICLFQGEDAEIIEKRSELLKKGLIPDTEKI